ncbi:hypothetical protein ACGFZB_39735 [Streptomyces cinerochromogenes]|uniref:Uncharacterized protein n=1 Tax=Streptomyces cinerochromogenes TaxID=66422 RepID=A0ABW7BL73_9ACTN
MTTPDHQADPPADHQADPPAGRPTVLLAPVTVTPAKPLTPSHLKGLLWTDVMFRATTPLADVTYRYSPTTYHLTEQTLGFWEFLDRTQGDLPYASLSEEEIGDLYVLFRKDTPPPAEALRPYAHEVERNGWVHPASERVLRLWTAHYGALGLHDPGLTRHQPPGLGTEEMVERLATLGMGLDQRAGGGPVYLDATRYGLPLRQIMTADGQPNYLACALRELLPLAPAYDEVVLLHDPELAADYLLLQRVLGALGPRVHRVPVGRVPIDGRIRSARHGGWHDHTAGALLRTVGTDGDPDVRRLGMRLYFIAGLGPGQAQSFRADLLHKSLDRAERLLRRADGHRLGGPQLHEELRRHRGAHTHVDPYRLTSSLLARSRRTLGHDLLSTVYL